MTSRGLVPGKCARHRAAVRIHNQQAWCPESQRGFNPQMRRILDMTVCMGGSGVEGRVVGLQVASGQWGPLMVVPRPGLQQFLRSAASVAELVVFTASVPGATSHSCCMSSVAKFQEDSLHWTLVWGGG